MRQVFVYRDGKSVNKETGEPMVSGAWKPTAPMTCPDMEGYQSPIDGKWIEGRRARRYDLESNGCIEAGDKKPRPFKNERFMKKHGLTND